MRCVDAPLEQRRRLGLLAGDRVEHRIEDDALAWAAVESLLDERRLDAGQERRQLAGLRDQVVGRVGGAFSKVCGSDEEHAASDQGERERERARGQPATAMPARGRGPSFAFPLEEVGLGRRDLLERSLLQDLGAARLASRRRRAERARASAVGRGRGTARPRRAGAVASGTSRWARARFVGAAGVAPPWRGIGRRSPWRGRLRRRRRRSPPPTWRGSRGCAAGCGAITARRRSVGAGGDRPRGRGGRGRSRGELQDERGDADQRERAGDDRRRARACRRTRAPAVFIHDGVCAVGCVGVPSPATARVARGPLAPRCAAPRPTAGGRGVAAAGRRWRAAAGRAR